MRGRAADNDPHHPCRYEHREEEQPDANLEEAVDPVVLHDAAVRAAAEYGEKDHRALLDAIAQGRVSAVDGV